MLKNKLKKWLSPLESTPLHPQWLVLRERAKTQLAIKEIACGRLLDIGCGNRWLENCLSHDVEYVGLDYPPTVSKGYPGKPDVFGDAGCLPFQEKSFDTVVLLDVMEHLERPDTSMAEVKRVLRKGGLVSIQVPFLYPLHDEPHDFQRWSVHGLEVLFKRHGFDVISVSHYGRPLETATALLAIALAKSVVDSASKRNIAILFAPLLLPLIPIMNVCAWFLAYTFPDSGMMPLGYRVIGVNSPDHGDRT